MLASQPSPVCEPQVPVRDPDSKAQGGWARERARQVKVPDELLHLSAVPRSHMAEEKADS